MTLDHGQLVDQPIKTPYVAGVMSHQVDNHGRSEVGSDNERWIALIHSRGIIGTLFSWNVRYWHEAEMCICTAHVAFGGKADMAYAAHMLLLTHNEHRLHGRSRIVQKRCYALIIVPSDITTIGHALNKIYSPRRLFNLRS